VDVDFGSDVEFAEAFEREGVESDAGGVSTGGEEVGGERVRDVDGHLHGVRVAFWVWWRGGGRQVGRCACGFTPAFGRVVACGAVCLWGD
jgi:hypothetical protein